MIEAQLGTSGAACGRGMRLLAGERSQGTGLTAVALHMQKELGAGAGKVAQRQQLLLEATW